MPLVDSFRIPGRAEGPILAARQFQIFFGQTFTPDRLANIFSSVTCVLKWMKDDRVGFPPSFQLATISTSEERRHAQQWGKWVNSSRSPRTNREEVNRHSLPGP